MTISRTTIDKLGIKLYDKVSAVVAELVANAYDADAESVTITLPVGQWLALRQKGKLIDQDYSIVVEDNGHGIPPADVNKFFLKVGLDRRGPNGKGSTSPKHKRKVMGRKGIGKLAPFGICKKMEILSAGGQKTASGFLRSHFILDYSKILKDTEENYLPEVGSLDGTFESKTGTTITLTDFERRHIPDLTTFNRQLARRFGLPTKDWRITITDALTDTSTVVGSFQIDVMENTLINLSDWKPVTLDEGTTLPVSGWIAYSKESYRDEEMAGIRVYARGKIVAQTRDFGIQSGFSGEHMARSYLVGEIHADWLDEDSGEDLVRTDRQDILWASERGEAFQKWGQELIREVAKRSSEPRRKKARDVFFEKAKLQEHATKRFADQEIQRAAVELGRMLGGVASLDELQDADYVNDLRELVLTVAPHKVLVDALREAGEDSKSTLETMVGVFGRAHVAEFASLGQVAHERVTVVGNLEAKLTPDTVEGVLQEILERAPWLIHPEWTVLSANETLDTLRSAFEQWYKQQTGETVTTTTFQDGHKRPDFVLLTFSGRLEIVEIKRPKHKLQDDEFDRLQSYIDKLTEFLDAHPKLNQEFPNGVHATLVCDGLSLKRAYQTAFKKLQDDGTLEHLKWLEFLKNTKKVHEDFLRVARKAYKAAGS